MASMEMSNMEKNTNLADHINIVEFTRNNRFAKCGGIYQYDRGQILRIKGLDLPKAVEVQFAYTESGGSAETRVGMTVDGVTDVQIPNEMLKNNRATRDYNIWAFVYVIDGDSGNTVYKMRLEVTSRPAPGEITEDPDEPHPFDEAINAVNAAASRAETAESNAKEYAADAKKASSEASESAENAKNDRKAVEKLKTEFDTATESVLKTATDARNEAESWAHGHVGYPDRDKDNAMYYSEAAKQVATKNGFCRMEIDENGHLILDRTENMKDSLDFRLSEKGHLEVMME